MKKLGAWGLPALVAAVILGWFLLSQRATPHTVKGRVGSSTLGFLHDPAVQRLLRQRYHLVVQAQVYGSVAMMTEPVSGLQFLWPESELDLDYYAVQGGTVPEFHTIFHSPLVLYSWDVVTEGLRTHGLVDTRAETYYVTAFPKLIELIQSHTAWADLGLPQLHGSVKIITTDPLKSNSGNSFAGLVANLMNRGEVVTLTDGRRFATLLPRLQEFFARLGTLQPTSAALWEHFLSEGIGAYPLIVGYENQIIEYSIAHPKEWAVLRPHVRVLYPQPTVWSSHPFIALDATGALLLHALQDPDLLRLGWERHGFRPALYVMMHDGASLAVPGVPTEIEAVIPTPTAAVMARLLEALRPPRRQAP